MTPQILANGALIVDDAVKESAAAFIADTQDRSVVHGQMTLDDGSTVELDRSLAELLQLVIRALPAGHVRIESMPEEITTTTAAGILGISRPTLMRLIADGEIASHKVGSHHRLWAVDVMRFEQKRRLDREKAFAELREIEEQLGIED